MGHALFSGGWKLFRCAEFSRWFPWFQGDFEAKNLRIALPIFLALGQNLS